MSPERLTGLPLEAARLVGQAVLWVTETLVPPAPSVETRAASIQYFNTDGPEDLLK